MCPGGVEFARAALDRFSFTLPVLPGTLFGKILANGRGTYAKRPGQLSDAVTLSVQLDNGISLLLCQHPWTPNRLSALPSVSHGGLDSLTDALAFKLGNDAEDRQREFTRSGGRVDDGLAGGLHPRLVVLDRLQDLQEKP